MVPTLHSLPRNKKCQINSLHNLLLPTSHHSHQLNIHPVVDEDSGKEDATTVVGRTTGKAHVGQRKITWKEESLTDSSHYKLSLHSSSLKDNPIGLETTLSQLFQVIFNLKEILETTGTWTLAALFICRISSIYFQTIKRLRMEVGQSKELDVVTIFFKPKEWETSQSKPMSTKNGIQVF
jgi:hypothetical protein